MGCYDYEILSIDSYGTVALGMESWMIAQDMRETGDRWLGASGGVDAKRLSLSEHASILCDEGSTDP